MLLSPYLGGEGFNFVNLSLLGDSDASARSGPILFRPLFCRSDLSLRHLSHSSASNWNLQALVALLPLGIRRARTVLLVCAWRKTRRRRAAAVDSARRSRRFLHAKRSDTQPRQLCYFLARSLAWRPMQSCWFSNIVSKQTPVHCLFEFISATHWPTHRMLVDHY